MKIQYVEVTEKTLTLMNSDVVPAHTIRVDGKPLTAGSKAPAGCEYVFEEQHDGWFKQMVRRLPQEFKSADNDAQHQLTIGQLIVLLEPHVGDVDSEMFPNTERSVCFWGDVVPYEMPMSYRGRYDELALSYCVDSESNFPVRALIARLNSVIGSELEGYKGGFFRMTKDTPVWASNWGRTGVPIVGVEGGEWSVRLIVGENEE